MFNPNQEISEYNAALEEERRVTVAAENRLATFGLHINTLRELSQQGLILDLGAEDAYIEREAKLSGFGDRVISADIKFNDQAKNLGLNTKEFDATKEWPLETNGFRLIICRQGPLFMTETSQESAMYILNNSLKSLTKQGELFVFPSRFGFVKAQMFKEFPEYERLQSLATRTQQEALKNNEFNEEADRRTKFSLHQLGYVFETRPSKGKENQSANAEFLVFRKS